MKSTIKSTGKSNKLMQRAILFTLIALLLSMSVQAFDFEVLETDPAPLVAGEYGDVTFKISEQTIGDSGNTPKDIRISIVESNDITVVGESEKLIGELRKGESITRTFRIFFDDRIPGGNIQIPFLVESSQGKSTVYRDVFIQDRKTLPDIRIGQIQTTPKEFLADTEDNTLTVTLQNLGETKAELVRAKLHIPQDDVYASSSFSLEDSLASIESGAEGVVEFDIDIEETVKENIPATLELRYRSRASVTDTYRIYANNISVMIDLSQSPFLEVVNVEHDEIRTGTTDNNVKVTITNTGEKEADSVRMRLHPDISYPFSFDITTVYVATELEPGETTTVGFNVEVFQSGSVRNYPIVVELEALVGETLYTREDNIDIDVLEGTKVSNQFVGIMIIGGVILVAIVFGFLNRPKKK